MHIRRISVAKYPYPFKQGNYYAYPISIRENCGYPQNIYPRIHIRASLGDMIVMYKISGNYDTAVTPRVTREHSYMTRVNDLRLEKVDQNTTCAKYFLITGYLVFGTVYLTMFCYATLLINLNLTLLNSGNIEILCMTIKLKFTEPKVVVHITRTSYIEYQYFVSFVFVMQA